MRQPSSLYKRHRFPGEIISHAVWLYFRFLLSYRDVEELLAERGHRGQLRDDPPVVPEVRADVRRRAAPAAPPTGRQVAPATRCSSRSTARKHWLWRAVDQDGIVLDILVQPRRNQEAAEAFLRRLVEGQGYRPRVVITDKLASYPPALRRVLPGVEHRRHKGLNNRAENSHRPTRRRERVLQRFKSPEHAQQFLAPFGPISDHFRPRRHRLPAPAYHQLLQTRFATWREVTGLAAA